MKRTPLCCRSLRAVAVLLCSVASGQDVVLNEISYASNERMLRWLPDGSPRLGSGVAWHLPTFNDANWQSGAAPFGWGSTVSTNLQSAMQNKTPSLYLRKTFTVSAGNAALTTPIILQADYDDGFVAYLNGVEIARANAGPSKHFLYAHQPAYNPRTAGGLEEFQGPAANTILVAGTNVLAIQAHNKAIGGNFRLNAGLKVPTSLVPITAIKASYFFNTANDASRTHTNNGGAITNTALGTPVPGGWLVAALDPTSTAATGANISVVTQETATGGLGGTGGLRYSFTQSGPGPAVAVRAPLVSMQNAWTPFSLAPTTLATTTLTFRYRTTGDLIFDFRMDPANGQAANSLDGFPRIGVPLSGTADYEWSAASGGYFDRIISPTGTVTTGISGSINIGLYDLFSGSGTLGGTLRILENNTSGSGPGGSTGHLAFQFVSYPTSVDSYGFRVSNLAVAEWAAGQITSADWGKTRLSFRWRLPVGKSMNFALEPTVSPTTANSIPLGNLVGSGNWEHFAAHLVDLPNAETLRTHSNNTFSRTFKFRAAYNGTPFVTGDSVEIDALNLYFENPTGTKEEHPLRGFSQAAGAARTLAVNGDGAVSHTTSGTPTESYSLYADPSVRGFEASVVEDNTPAGGNGGSTGFLRCTVNDTQDASGPWGFVLPNMQVRNWTPGNILPVNLQDAVLQFAAKIPSGITIQLFAVPPGGSTTNRALLGSFTGNGTWQVRTAEFITATNVEAFRAALNAATTNQFQLHFVCPTNPALGHQISLDDMQILTWRSYSTLLSQGQNQQRFLDYLNLNGLTQFIPTFSKTNSGPAGSNLVIDNFEVSYTGPDPNAVQQLLAVGAAAGTWRYFVGLAEPSGGVFDPNLLTGVTIPPGEEDDYDNPQNFRDWVELRNTTNASISLANWSLTDDDRLPAKWKFPVGTSIPAQGYLLVMCDNRDETNPTGAYLHTNFELSAKGEKVQLYNASGVLVDQVTNVPDQDTWNSWARNPANNSWGFSDTATPLAPNSGVFTSARVKSPDFFKADGITKFPGGFYTGAQTLVLKSETPGATIRYTLDGSDPTDSVGSLYTAPLTLTAPNNKTAVVVRAAAFRNGWLPSDIKTHTFLIDQHASLRTLPALLFNGDAGRNFYLPMGILAINGNTTPEIWTPTGPQTYNIPINRGDAYERVISAEFYYPDGRDGWREQVGIRVSSSPYSRPRLKMRETSLSPFRRDHVEKCSFNLFWRDDYGNPNMDHATIPDTDTRQFKQLRVRAGKNDMTNPFFLDELGRRLFQKMGWVQAVGGWNSLYINGAFKGLYNTCERIREPMFQYHHRSNHAFDVRYISDQVDGDATFWNQMQTALNVLGPSPTLANYQTVTNYLDPVNVADYFLWMFYINMDDWMYGGFANNWAAYRERSPEGRYRFLGWDLEAAFGRFGKVVTYDTIAWVLNTNNELSNVFQDLYQSPEFRLLFADRIQKHMFNQGALDDRPATAYIKTQKDRYVSEIQPVIRFIENNAGLNLDVGWFNNHVNPSTGRRAFLLGPSTTVGSFRNKGLWPNTEPPVFSQHGGIVAANYPLTITAPTGGTIYYTLDGTDPRLPGGAVSPTALIYTSSVPLSSLTNVKSRVRSASGEWSPLTEAFFQPGAVPPNHSNLVIAEIMYRPPDPTDAEAAAGHTDGGDFEFLRLQNIAATPVDLRQLSFTAGVTFSFAGSDIQALAPGASVLVVKRQAAFEKRFGTSLRHTIAGEYNGALNNGGEQIRLEWGSGNPPVQQFVYDDDPPWPSAPDGYGPSLLLKNPSTAPNHANPANWTHSAQPGGLPSGGARTMTYATWQSLSFPAHAVPNPAISAPLSDPDFDGLTNLDEYALGSPALFPDTSNWPVMGLETISGTAYVTLEYRHHAAATGITLTPQSSSDLHVWQSGPTQIIPLGPPRDNGDGTVSQKIRDAQPFAGPQRRYLRVQITGP